MRIQVGIILAATLAQAVGASVAQAQTVPEQTAIVPAPAPQTTVVAAPPVRERTTRSGPNPSLLMNGLFTFGIPYGISAVVAAESTVAGDKNLFIPVVGPWLAYANKGNCNVDDASCGRSTTSKVLFTADGIFQAIGVIELAVAFLMPATSTETVARGQTHVMLVPSRVGPSGYGFAAAGTF